MHNRMDKLTLNRQSQCLAGLQDPPVEQAHLNVFGKHRKKIEEKKVLTIRVNNSSTSLPQKKKKKIFDVQRTK